MYSNRTSSSSCFLPLPATPFYCCLQCPSTAACNTFYRRLQCRSTNGLKGVLLLRLWTSLTPFNILSSRATSSVDLKVRGSLRPLARPQKSHPTPTSSMRHICTICQSPFLLDSDSATVYTETVVTTCGTRPSHTSHPADIWSDPAPCGHRSYIPPGLHRAASES